MKRARISKGIITLSLLFFGLLVFEIFNYYTSKIALDDIFAVFGTVTILGYQTTLGALLAVGAATIDIGGILRIFTPEQGKHEPDWVQSAYIFWILASAVNACLTWWVVRLGLLTPVRMPPELIGKEGLISVLIALFVWAIRYGLVRNVGTTGDAFINVQLPTLLGTGGAAKSSYYKATKKPATDTGRFKTLKSLFGNKGGAKGGYPTQPIQTLGGGSSGLQFSLRPDTKSSLGKPSPPLDDEDDSDDGGNGKWGFAEFKKAVGSNKRFLNDKNKLAKIAGVSLKTIYRWSKKAGYE